MDKFKIVSWNVNGIRAVAQKAAQNKRTFSSLFQEWSADIVCFQETKVDSIRNVDDEIAHIEGFESFWSFSRVKKGISGVATYVRKGLTHFAQTSFGCEKFDREGRIVRIDLSDFVLFNVYFPNAGRGPERLAYKLEFYAWFQSLCESLRNLGKSVVVVGDVNTTHSKLDIYFPEKTDSPFTDEEVGWITKFVTLGGFVDTFRLLHPEDRKYTWWDPKTNQRPLDNGYRLDYCFVSSDLVPVVLESDMMTTQGGSDHCPVYIVLDASALQLARCSVVQELSSERLKKKQPTLLNFLRMTSSSSNQSLPEGRSLRAASSTTSETTIEQLPKVVEDQEAPPASKKRKLTEFFPEISGD